MTSITYWYLHQYYQYYILVPVSVLPVLHTGTCTSITSITYWYLYQYYQYYILVPGTTRVLYQYYTSTMLVFHQQYTCAIPVLHQYVLSAIFNIYQLYIGVDPACRKTRQPHRSKRKFASALACMLPWLINKVGLEVGH